MPFDRAELVGPWARPVVLRAGSVLRIGRAPGNDVVIEHPSVSRSHAIVEWRGESVTLRDLGSSNGSRLDGKAVLKDHTVSVGDGAVISLGDVLLNLRMVATGTPADVRAGKFENRAALRSLLVELESTNHAGTLELVCGEQKVLLGYERGLVIAARSGELLAFPVVEELIEGAWAHRGTYRISDVQELPKQPLRVRMSEVMGDEPPPPQRTRETERLRKRPL